MNILVLIITFIVSISNAAGVDLSSIAITPERLNKLSKAEQIEYLKSINQIMYNIESLQRKNLDLMAQSGPPFFLFRFSTAHADTIEGFVAGQMCLYGGWKSTVKNGGPKGTYCPRPTEGVKCEATKDDGGKTQNGFTCNIWGYQPSVCVPLEPLPSLTHRCVTEIEKRFEQLGSEGISQEELKKLQAELKDFADGVKDSQKSFNQFCSSTAEYARQTSECDAIARLIKKVTDILDIPNPVDIAPAPAPPTDGEDTPQRVVDTDKCMDDVLIQHYGQTASQEYKDFLEIMAHQCGGPGLSKQKIQGFKAHVYSAIGFCWDYKYNGKEDKINTREKRQRHLTVYRTQHHTEMKPNPEVQFDDIFGMTIEIAENAFCTNNTDPYFRQKNYQTAIKPNRTSPGNDRAETGWQNCDAQIQNLQGKPVIEGVRESAAKKMLGPDGKLIKENGRPWRMPIGYANFRTSDAKIPPAKSDGLSLINWDSMLQSESPTAQVFRDQLNACLHPNSRWNWEKGANWSQISRRRKNHPR